MILIVDLIHLFHTKNLRRKEFEEVKVMSTLNVDLMYLFLLQNLFKERLEGVKVTLMSNIDLVLLPCIQNLLKEKLERAKVTMILNVDLVYDLRFFVKITILIFNLEVQPISFFLLCISSSFV